MAAAAFTTRRALLKGGVVLTIPVSQAVAEAHDGTQQSLVLSEIVEQLAQMENSTLVIVRNMLRHFQSEAVET